MSARPVPAPPSCHWVDCADAGPAPFVTAYRLRFRLPARAGIAVDITADERYELFLDGRRVGRGSERGDAPNWFFETVTLTLPAGPHVLVARVWSLGDLAPFAQMSSRPGFFLRAHGRHAARLNTGLAPWEARVLPGYGFTGADMAWGTGTNLEIDGRVFPWRFETGRIDGWQPARRCEPAETAFGPYGSPARRRLRPATLPPMLETPRHAGRVRHIERLAALDTRPHPVLAARHLRAAEPAWQRWIGGGASVTVPPRSHLRVLIDIGDYCCAYPELLVSGGRGALIRLQWAEALFLEPEGRRKGHRDEIEGRFFIGTGDTFHPDGGAHRRFETLWWQAGRYLELVIRTAAAPLTLEHLVLRETRYPLAVTGSFAASDPRLEGITPMAVRSLQMCMHETYMDCPYYEQLMYVGDTRLECLTTYQLTADARLPRKALCLFDASRDAGGLTQSRYPNRSPQCIPPFSLWWVAMVHDYALWRRDPAFVAQRMPGVRAVIEAFLREVDSSGVLQPPAGWNFVDWVPGWDRGVPPDGESGPSGILNWHLVYTLRRAADLERWAGEPGLAGRLDKAAARLAASAAAAFWDERRGLFADDLARTRFSEHAQCLALLSGQPRDARMRRAAEGLLTDPALARTTIYFSHYLFEAYGRIGRIDRLLERMSLWFDAAVQGFRTTPESPEPSRSDCHAWGAHPLYHYRATILGVQPTAPGFAGVRIAPQLGPLDWARGSLPHPLGMIRVDVRRQGRQLTGSVTLPRGLDQVEFAGWQPRVLIRKDPPSDARDGTP